MAYENLKFAVKSIADMCDGARFKDSIGFNKPDAGRMHQFAYMKKWTRSEALDAYERIYKYKNKQLPALGIDYDDIPDPSTEEYDFYWEKKQAEDWDYSTLVCEQVDEMFKSGEEKVCAPPLFVKRFFADKDIRMKFRLEKDERGIWWVARVPEPEPVVEYSSIKSIEDLRSLNWSYIRESKMPNFKASLYHHAMVPGFWDLWKAFKPELKAEGFGCAREEYSGEWYIKWWKQTPEEIPEGVEPEEKKEYDFSDTILYEWQQEHASKLAYSLDKYKISIDNSGCGAGKTPINLSVFKKLGLKPFVICPKPVIPAWYRNAEMVGIEMLGVVNYESAKLGKQTIRVPYKKKEGYKLKNVDSEYISVSVNPNAKKFDSKYIYTFTFPENAVLVFDEVHRCKNMNTQNTQLLLQAAQQGIRIAGLSATLASSPMKMYAVGTALKLFDTEHYWGFWNWVKDHGCSKEVVKYKRGGEPVHAWVYDGDESHMRRIHTQIGDRMNGIDLAKLIKIGKFPTSQILAEAYNLNGNTAKLDKVYEQLLKLADEYEKEADYYNAQEDGNLSKRQKLHQQVELLKIPAIVDLVKDALGEDKSVAIFVNFTETLHQLGDVLKTNCFIYGDNSSRINEQNRLAFENNESHIIICNIAAAREGIDLHDKYDKRERLSIIIPSDNAQNIKQALGRVQRAGGTHSQQILFYAAGTIEENICYNLKGKLKNISALNDTDLMVKF
jgi:superfamily II DNA or RNA helicase